MTLLGQPATPCPDYRKGCPCRQGAVAVRSPTLSLERRQVSLPGKPSPPVTAPLPGCQASQAPSPSALTLGDFCAHRTSGGSTQPLRPVNASPPRGSLSRTPAPPSQGRTHSHDPSSTSRSSLRLPLWHHPHPSRLNHGPRLPPRSPRMAREARPSLSASTSAPVNSCLPPPRGTAAREAERDGRQADRPFHSWPLAWVAGGDRPQGLTASPRGHLL